MTMVVLVERNARCNDVGRRRATDGDGNHAKDCKKSKEEIATTNNNIK
jgi:hypothetical protein